MEIELFIEYYDGPNYGDQIGIMSILIYPSRNFKETSMTFTKYWFSCIQNDLYKGHGIH
jgi:hypothetical protein